MIRKIAELLISRSLDEGQPLPSWLQRFVQRNTRLRQFETQSHQLDAALRTSAAEHRQAMATALKESPPLREGASGEYSHTPHTTHNQTRPLRWLAPLAVAASLLLILTPNLLRSSTPRIHADEITRHLTTVPGGVLNLLNRAAKTSQTHLPQLSPLANLSMPTLPNWQDLALNVETPVYEKLDTLRTNWQNLKLRFHPEAENSANKI